jgi:serine phosphatase RsbU (regulator of sigma subunit)
VLQLAGTLLGALPRIELDAVDFTLGREETLLLYTDGIIESRDQQGGFLDEIGLCRLIASFPCDPGTLIGRLREVTEKQLVTTDDVAMLALAAD